MAVQNSFSSRAPKDEHPNVAEHYPLLFFYTQVEKCHGNPLARGHYWPIASLSALRNFDWHFQVNSPGLQNDHHL
jgi:hypothetical protein